MSLQPCTIKQKCNARREKRPPAPPSIQLSDVVGRWINRRVMERVNARVDALPAGLPRELRNRKIQMIIDQERAWHIE